jgi:hypothetical protein
MPNSENNATPKGSNSSSSAHDDYELPDEIDFSKTTVVGFGLESLDRYLTETHGKPRTAQLAADVATAFPTDDDVNDALRRYYQIRQLASHRRPA